MTEDGVSFQRHENGVATITLNQPETLNALTLDMLIPMRDKLRKWRDDDTIKLVLLEGAGSKGFSSGGDMKTLYQAINQSEALEEAERFFEVEYKTDELVASFPKQIVVCMDGVVMGGGVGLSYGASHRIVTEKTKWAMPEMNLGFFPDVGAAYFLNQAPGYTGRYLALTAQVLRAADVLYINAADYMIASDKLDDLKHAIAVTNWHRPNRDEILDNLLQSYSMQPEQPATLAELQTEIDAHFAFESVETIVAALDQADTPFARETMDTMLSKSPVSLKVALAQLIKGETNDLRGCLEVDRTLARNFMQHNDFFEGVRSVLIDKDQAPQYDYRQLSDVSDELVNSFFQNH
ncbi:enoyl-CoA hydratase/isomerase family protein [Barrientosiimonas marina]|uniref:3-hydroxyisobutyryl-CoA hydrolase n=1 Tax=Lentibacillus kimchii TaxID=1542911 RepID=A0ABW2UR72_9BACI